MKFFSKLFAGKDQPGQPGKSGAQARPAVGDPKHPASAEIAEAAALADRVIHVESYGLRVNTDDTQKLVAVLDRALVKAPDDIDLMLARSAALACGLQMKSAEEAIDRVLAIDPNHFHARQLKDHPDSWKHVMALPSWKPGGTTLHPQMLARLKADQSVQLVRDSLGLGLAIVRQVSRSDFPTPLTNTMPSKWDVVWSDTPAGPIVAHYLVLGDNPRDPYKAEAMLPLLASEKPSAASGYWMLQLLPLIGSCHCVFVIGETVIYNRRQIFSAEMRAKLQSIAAKTAKHGPISDVSQVRRAADWHAQHFDMQKIVL